MAARLALRLWGSEPLRSTQVTVKPMSRVTQRVLKTRAGSVYGTGVGRSREHITIPKFKQLIALEGADHTHQ